MPNEIHSRRIWPPAEAFYIESMLFNSRSAVASIKRVSEILMTISVGTAGKSGGEIEMDDILNHLQNIVAKGAALSRYFWPIKKSHEWRGKQIRASFGISDDSPLSSRDLRNDIEHFDERLDDYLDQGIVGYILPQYVGKSVASTEVASHIFRAYFVDSGKFELLGRQYEIPPIAGEILKIHDKLISCTTNGSRFP